MGSSYKWHKNVEQELYQRILKAGDRAAITLQSEIKKTLSGASPASSGSPPGVKTGALRRSIQVDNRDRKNGRWRVGTNLVYARIQEFGGVIRAKTAKFLKFQINGQWISKESVFINPHPYMRPSIKKCKSKIKSLFKNLI